MEKVIVIKSKDRVNYQTTDSGSFKINFDQPLSDTNSQMSCKLSCVCIPKGFFNIYSQNNTFSVNMQGDAIYIVTLTSGYYTIGSLCTALQTALNAFNVSYTDFTVTYSATNQTITVASVANNFKIVNTELAKLTGIYNTASQSFALSQTSNGSLQFLSQPTFFYMDINELSKNIYNSNNRCVSTFMVPILQQSPSSIDMESNVYISGIELDQLNSTLIIDDPRINSLNITLYDSNMTVVNLRYSDWIFTLSLKQI